MVVASVQEEYTLLDVIGALAEKWWALILILALSAGVSYFFSPVPVAVFQSEAIVRLSPSQNVLLSQLPNRMAVNSAGQAFSAPVSKRFNDTDLYLITVQGQDPADVTRQLQENIDSLMAWSLELEGGSDNAMIVSIEQLVRAIAAVRGDKTLLPPKADGSAGGVAPVDGGEADAGWDALSQKILELRQAAVSAGLSAPAVLTDRDVIVAPTAGELVSPKPDRKKSAMIFASIAFFASAALILAIDVLKRTPRSAVSEVKIGRIRRAFGLAAKSNDE